MEIFEYDKEKHLAMEREEEQSQKRGKELGEKRLEQLLSGLFRSGKTEDAQKAVADRTFRDKLCKEYGIS